MSHIFKRGMAFALAGMLMLQSFFPASAAGVEQTVSMNNAVQMEETVSSNTLMETEEADENTQELTDEQTVVSENTVEERASLQEEIEEQEDQILLNYVYVQNPVVETPGTQMVLVEAGNEDISFDKAVLTYENYRTGESFSTEGQTFEEAGNLVRFEETFQDIEESGIYVIKEVTFYYGEKSKNIVLADTGIVACFGVNEEVQWSDEAVEDAYDIETSIITIDGEGNTEEASSIEEALERAQAQLGTESLARAGASNGDVVVVLDPGHDSTHLGARANNLKEEELTFKIAQYCKAELEEYSGVTVYMTRTSTACPHPGTTSTVCNSNRVAYAKSVGANVYVSIHLNANNSSSPSGAEVYYPNANYNAEVGNNGKQLAQQIQNKLVALGLVNRGIKIMNSQDNSKYPDGSLADYYGVIKNSKLNGFPGIIIEHAFITNASDAALLSSEENLKKLGVADAEGIAEYFSLSKGTTEFSVGDIQILNVDSMAGTFTVSVNSVEPAKKVSKVQFKVYTKSDKSDMKVYNGKALTGGGYSAKISASKHQNAEGKYYIEVYAVDSDGASTKLGFKTQDLTPSFKAKLSAAVTGSNNTNYKITATNISGASSVRFLFYYKSSGKSKGVYYKGKQDKNGNWYANIPLKKMVNEGKYKVYVYAKAAYGNEKQAGTKTFNYTRNMSVSVKATSKTQKKYKITAGGLAYASKVEFQVYSKTGGKDDLKTYKAKKDSNGVWYYSVPIKNHKTAGKYYVSVYATIEKKRISVGKKTFNVSGPTDATTSVSVNSVKGTMTLDIKNLSSPSGIESVKVKVWTKKDKSDAQWVKAKVSKGNYKATIKLSKFKYYYGKYNMEVYATDNNKIYKKVASKTKKVTQPSVTMTATLNKAETKYKVTVPDVSYASKMEIRIWKTGTSKKKAKVYKAKKDSKGVWYYNVKATDFTKVGKYKMEAHATLGSKVYVVGSTSIMRASVDNLDESGYYTIMGDAGVTLNQMISYYQANATYPDFYANSDAPTLKKFCQLYMSECEAEGVKVEVAFAQAMKETNFLRYGGDVSIEQYNFAGIGATGGGEPGCSFANVQTGIRAQIQHLKAYASEDDLVNAVVDPRFQYVKRGTCKYVEWLGINENPNHVGWATAVGYGSNIVERIKTLKSY